MGKRFLIFMMVLMLSVPAFGADITITINATATQLQTMMAGFLTRYPMPTSPVFACSITTTTVCNDSADCLPGEECIAVRQDPNYPSNLAWVKAWMAIQLKQAAREGIRMKVQRDAVDAEQTNINTVVDTIQEQ